MKYLLAALLMTIALPILAQDAIDKQIKKLYSSTLHTNPAVISFLKEQIVDGIRFEYDIPVEAAEDSFNTRVINMLGSKVQNKSINKILNLQKEKVQSYNTVYGPKLLHSIKIKNGEVNLSAGHISDFYTYANGVIFDTITSRLMQESRKLVAKHILALQELGTPEANAILAQLQSASNPAAVNMLFHDITKQVDTFYKGEMARQLKKFEALKENINRELTNGTQKLDVLIAKAEQHTNISRYQEILHVDNVAMQIKDFSEDYLGYKLAELKEKNQGLFEQIKKHDPAQLQTFLKNTEQELLTKYNKNIEQQISNVAIVQNKYKEQFLDSKQEIENCFQAAKHIAEADVSGILKGYVALSNVLPVVTERFNTIGRNIEKTEAEMQQKLAKFYDDHVQPARQKVEAVVFLANFLNDVYDYTRKPADNGNKIVARAEQDIMQTAQSFAEDARGYLHTSQMVLGSLQVLGIGNSELLKDISEGISMAEGAMNAVSAFATGNYLGAVTGLVGMFGKKSDAAAARHKEIMQAFKVINMRLDIIDRKLDVVIENQKKMYDLQVKTYEELLKLQDTVAKEFSRLNIKIDDLDTKVNALLTKDYKDNYDGCFGIKKELRLSETDARLPSLEHFNTVFIKSGDKPDCRQVFLNGVLRTDGKVNHLYLKRLYEDSGEKDSVLKANLRQQEELYKTLKQRTGMAIGGYFNKNKSGRNVTLSLISPSFTYDEIDFKLSQNTISIDKAADTSVPAAEYLNSLISPQASKDAARLLLSVHQLLTVTDPDNNHNLYDINHKDFTVHIKSSSYQTEKYLLNILRLTNAVIAEENLLSGDLLLEDMRRDYQRYLTGNSQQDTVRWRENNAILNHNFAGLLYHNFIRYYILKQVDELNKQGKPVNIGSYKLAYDLKDEALMNNNKIRFPFPIVYLDSQKAQQIISAGQKVKAGWNCNIAGKYHYMPAPEELTGDDGFTIVYNKNMYELLNYRDMLINTYESYRLDTYMKDEDKPFYFYSASSSPQHIK